MTGGPSDEAAHRVTDEGNLGDRNRPDRGQLIQALGETTAAVRDVAAAVVANIERGVGELGLEALTVGLVASDAEPPGVLGLAQAVQEDRDPGAGLGDGGGERVPVPIQGLATVPDGHRHGQGIAGALEHVSESAVQRPEGEPRAGVGPKRRGLVAASQPVGVSGA